MLRVLSIRNIVLIEHLELEFQKGLCVLTGETGAGKSILLDALALALGGRGDGGLLRKGAGQGSVSVSFELPPEHAVHAILAAAGLVATGLATNDLANGEVDGEITLRRQIGSDGRSRAFINDQPVNVATLRDIGSRLVEIHGQNESRGLLDPASHRDYLDEFAGLGGLRTQCEMSYRARGAALAAVQAAEAVQAEIRADEDYLRHVLAELDLLQPEIGEEASLREERQLLKESGRLLQALQDVNEALDAGVGSGLGDRLRHAMRSLNREAPQAQGLFDEPLAQLDKAAEELALAEDALARAGQRLQLDPQRLETLEDRLHGLHEAARKHRVDTDALAALRDHFAERLRTLDDGVGELQSLQAAHQAAVAAYDKIAAEMSKRRTVAARKLEKALRRELPSLALEKAVFLVNVETDPEAQPGPLGLDKIRFLVTTNPGTDPGPLHRVASGGEMSRFMLALKVALHDADGGAALIFDEVDAGIGGATAARVGKRLAALADDHQVIVVTHAPQVAALADRHYLIEKRELKGQARTDVTVLSRAERQEEIARMLAGAEITNEARAAAGKLMLGGAG